MSKKLTPFEIHFTKLAELFGEKSRALMLWHLSDGRPYTASELAFCVDISAQSASNHLSKLIQLNIIGFEKKGRYKYYKITNPQVAQVLENMAGLIPKNYDRKLARKLESEGTKFARTCYDHLAGKIGVDITSAMIQKGVFRKTKDEFTITKFGAEWFEEFGIEIGELKSKKRALVYHCLDWTEKQHHIGGALGSAFLDMMLNNDWVRKKKHSREVLITAKGKSELYYKMGINI